MSPLRRMRARRRRGAAATAGRLVAPVLILLTALLVARAAAATGARGAVSDVCVPPVPVGASCSTTASTTTSSSRSSQSTGTSSTSTAGTTSTETETSTGSSTTATDTTATTTTSTVSTAGGTRTTAGASPSAAVSRFPPPPPPLPAASPGASPAAEAVQRIVLVPAAAGTIAPGDTVEVQATLEAQRGTDIFAVPGVPVTFALLSSTGNGASIAPLKVTSDATGVALVRVRTGDQPGDTVVSASTGAASAQLALHTDVRATGAAAHVNPPATGTDASPSGGHGLLWVASLIVVGALGVAGMTLYRRPGGA